MNLKNIAVNKRVIINADDFGLSPEINAGIIAAHRDGCVTSTSILANFPAFIYGVDLLKSCPNLTAGVHLNFNEGRPLSDVRDIPSLVSQDGSFITEQQYLSNPSAVRVDDLKQEFRRQIEKVVSTGIKPSHLDNHLNGIYLRADLFSVVVDLAEAYSLPIRFPFDKRFPWRIPEWEMATGFERQKIVGVATAITATLAKNKCRHPDYFWLEFTSLWRTVEGLIKVLDMLDEGIHEICVHPGTAPVRRKTELDILTSSEVKEALNAKGVELVSYHVLD